jgi:hypothetical protein
VVDPDTVSVKPDGDLVTLDLAGAHVHAQALDSYEAAVHGARICGGAGR